MSGERIVLDGGKPEPGEKFEPGSVLAWVVDQEGYRSGTSEWTFSPIEGLAGAKSRGRKVVDVSEAVGEDVGLPHVRVEPGAGGTIRVTARVRLVVQAYGEASPIETGQAVVVPYGSVVRAGPVLIAPLYAEQVESVRSDRMPLPRPGGGFFEEQERMTSLDAAGPKNPRRWILWTWGALWIAAFPLSAAFALYLATYPVDGHSPHVQWRTIVYSIGGMWFLIILVGAGIHTLVSRFVHAAQPELD